MSFSFIWWCSLVILFKDLHEATFSKLRHNFFVSIVNSVSTDQVEISILRSEFLCSCAVNTLIIIKYYKTNGPCNNFEISTKQNKPFWNDCEKFVWALQFKITANYSNAYGPREEHKSSELSIMLTVSFVVIAQRIFWPHIANDFYYGLGLI